MEEFKTKLHKFSAVSLEITFDCATVTPLKVTFRGCFTVNIRSWKIHKLILAVTGIPNKKQLSSMFELVFFMKSGKKF